VLARYRQIVIRLSPVSAQLFRRLGYWKNKQQIQGK